jgi:hypothetical protein
MASCALQTPDWGSILVACCIVFPNICWAAMEYERDINAGDFDPSLRGAGLTAGSTSVTRMEIALSGRLFGHNDFSTHFAMTGTAEIIAMERKRSRLGRREFDPVYLSGLDVGSDLKPGAVKAVQAVCGSEFQDDRYAFFQRDFTWTEFELFGRHFYHFLRGSRGPGKKRGE